MAKPPRSKKLDLADRLCDAIKHLTAERASRSYALQWFALSDVAQHLGISDASGGASGPSHSDRRW